MTKVDPSSGCLRSCCSFPLCRYSEQTKCAPCFVQTSTSYIPSTLRWRALRALSQRAACTPAARQSDRQPSTCRTGDLFDVLLWCRKKKSSCNEAQTQMPPSMPAVCCQFCNGWFALRFSTTNAARSTHYFFLLFFPSDCIPLDDALIFSAILPRDSVLVRVLEHSETPSDPFSRLQSTLTSQKKVLPGPLKAKDASRRMEYCLF